MQGFKGDEVCEPIVRIGVNWLELGHKMVSICESQI